MKKIAAIILYSFFAVLISHAALLFEDSTNYPYTNGCIEGQGQWYCYYPANTTNLDALVTNNVLFLNSSNHDEVATPTNGWVNPTEFSFASFSINVSQLPSNTNGGYFAQFQNNADSNDCCHIFVDTRGVVVPGTYRLGIANFSTSFSSLVPPVNYPLDLATGVTYTVVILFDNDENSDLAGSQLWINPSEQDYENDVNGDAIAPGIGSGYVYALDTATSAKQESDLNVTQIGFAPYVNAGISNVIVGTAFDDVNTTNPPVIAIQPQPGTNYSGNNTMFYTVASGVDLTYQWFSTTYGQLSDGVNYVGSTSNVLVVNNLSASDNYYAVVTDAYGNTATSATAVETVITTPTAPFFPASVTAVNSTNNLFTSASFTDIALGTGPLYYQWYFAPTNTPNTFTPLAGQTGSTLTLNLADYTYAGNYYVVASNSIAGGSIVYGPTNSLVETVPLVATISQLHNLMISLYSQIIANKSGTVNVNTNNVTVGGYVTTFGGYGSTYSEFFIQDAAGYGIEVYLAANGNTNTPPVGTYVTVTGPVLIYHTELEIEPATISGITTNIVAPVVPFGPKFSNANFNDLSTNGLGTNAILESCSLITFTNVYIYGSRTGGAIGNGGIFYTNSYSTAYFTVGKYHSPDNTNTMEVYQYAYNYGTTNNSFGTTTSPFYKQAIPTNCYQLTGAYLSYGGTAEILPSRLQDYVTNPPASFPDSVALTKGAPTITWPVQAGSTYSVYSTTNLLGSWTQAAYGLGYYPTNGTFTDTNTTSAKFYIISTP